MRLPNDINIHTHGIAPRRDAVVCFDPVDLAVAATINANRAVHEFSTANAVISTDVSVIPAGEGPVSIGIHPWNAGRADEAAWRALEHALDNDSRVVAVGEIGLDRLRDPALDIQATVFQRQARMAEERGLPVVIHCVRAIDALLRLRKRLHPEIQWIIHGFRSNASTARQLLDAGIDLSFSRHYNADAYTATPTDRRYFETD